MKRLRIIQKDTAHRKIGEPHIDDGALPLFYMSDYSVTGLVVGGLQETLHLFEEKGFFVNKGTTETEVHVDNAIAMLHILQLLRDHDIEFEMTDLVDQVYQG